jgi:hypothetical protein
MYCLTFMMLDVRTTLRVSHVLPRSGTGPASEDGTDCADLLGLNSLGTWEVEPGHRHNHEVGTIGVIRVIEDHNAASGSYNA